MLFDLEEKFEPSVEWMQRKSSTAFSKTPIAVFYVTL
jgi:hypothetical protein